MSVLRMKNEKENRLSYKKPSFKVKCRHILNSVQFESFVNLATILNMVSLLANEIETEQSYNYMFT